MGWDHDGRYFTRSRRANGRVIREYVGGGKAADLIAQLDAIKREEREAERAVAQAVSEEVVNLDAPLGELNELADLLVKAALLAAGFHQHNRGNWRKCREQRDEAD